MSGEGASAERQPRQPGGAFRHAREHHLPQPEPWPQDGPGGVLIDSIPSPNGNHNAGDLHFGKDDKLYVSTGDGACDYNAPTRCQPENTASRDRNVLLGKVLRINSDGTIPVDNLFAATSNGVRCGTLTNNNARGGSAAPPGTLCKETYS